MALTQILIADAKGLHLQANSLSMVPDGALEVASNVVVAQDGIVRKRRGLYTLTAAASLTSPTGLVDYLGYLFVAHNGILARVDTNAGTLTSLSGTVSISSGSKPRHAKANGNLYLATSTGIAKLESSSATVLKAGIPRGLDVEISLSTNSGIFAPNKAVGYRILFGRLDANSNKVIGAPSELTTKSNTYIGTASSASNVGTTVTVTGVTHGLTVGDSIVVADADGTNTNGTWLVATTPTSTSFTFTVTSAPVGLTRLSFGVYRTPTVTFTLPSELTTEYFYQVYRTTQTASLAVSVQDDGQLVFEANLTSTNISNGYATFTDNIEEIFKGAYLYTNPNTGEGNGIASANDRPPFARDLCLFRDRLWFANTESNYSLDLGLISVRTGSFAAADYLVVTSGATVRRYVATTSLPASAGGSAASTPSTATTWDYGIANAGGYHYFYLSNSTSTEVSVPIATTAKSLCKAINRDSSSPVYAYYVSGADDVPGQMFFVSRSLTPTFSLTVNTSTVGGCFQPTLPTSGTTVAASNDSAQNAVYFSKASQPEAVPALQFLTVGSKTAQILRVIALRDSIIVLKSDGVFRVSGDSADNFDATVLDSTIVCVAADSVVTLNNQVFFLSNQGVVAVSESGAQVLSRAIEPLLTAIIGKSYIAAQTDAVAYESERLYLLSTCSPNSATADTVYCYNTVTSAWTTWTKTFADALVNPADDVLYMLSTAGAILKERKNQTKLDCSEESSSGTVGTVHSTTIAELTIATLTPEVGDAVVESGSDVVNRITAVDTSVTPARYTFAAPVSFEASDTVTLYKPISSEIRTVPLTMGDPSRWKQFSEFQCHFRNRSCSKMTIQFITAQLGGSNPLTWEAVQQQTGWGYGWGTSPWGGESTATVYTTGEAQIARVWVPLETQRATFIQVALTHSLPAETFEIQAMAYSARAYGPRVTR